MAVLNNGLQLLGVGADLTQIIKGLVLLIAVAFDVYNKTQGKTSIIGMLMKNFGRSSDRDPARRDHRTPKKSSPGKPDRLARPPDPTILRTPPKESEPSNANDW